MNRPPTASIAAVVLLALSSTAVAQDAQEGEGNASEPAAVHRPRNVAVERPQMIRPRPRPDRPPQPAIRPSPAPDTGVTAGEQAEGSAAVAGRPAPQAAAQRRHGRPRPGPVTARPREGRPPVGRAVPRQWVPPSRPSVVYIDRGYRRYPTTSFRYGYPYGYGSFGLGFFYYDPWYWNSSRFTTYSAYPTPPAYYPPASGGYGRYGFRVTGELRLKVRPHHAQVFVDGYYAGVVDDFDGTFQRLTADEGPHRIEIRAPGYETLVVDIRILPGETITYRGELRPLP